MGKQKTTAEICKELKAELKKRFGIVVKTTQLQSGCIGVTHLHSESIKVRGIAKLVFKMQYILPEEYNTVFRANTKANTIIY